MAHASSAQSNAEQAKYIPYGPMRLSSIEIIQQGEPWFVKEDGTRVNIMPHLPTNPEHMQNAVIADPHFWADNGDEVKERYDAWMNEQK